MAERETIAIEDSSNACELFVQSNYGNDFDDVKLLENLKKDIDDEVFYVEMKEVGDVIAMGINIKQVKELCDYFTLIVTKLENKLTLEASKL